MASIIRCQILSLTSFEIPCSFDLIFCPPKDTNGQSDLSGTSAPSPLGLILKWLSVCGLLFTCLGYYSLTSLGQNSSVLGIILRLTVLGLGQAVFQPPNLSATMGSVSKERVGIAGGIHGTMRHLGNLAGIAIVGSYFSARRASIMESQALAGPAKEIATSSFLGALHETFFLSLLIAIIALATSLLQKSLRTKGYQP